MKISVVTVCYNSAATIADTLASVAVQRGCEVEHIIIDGASKDDTLAIVKQFPHVAMCVSERDRGIYDAMNKGVARATGDVVALLNADDIYAHENILSYVAQQFQEHAIEALLGDVVFFKPEQPDKITRRYDSSQFSPAKIAWGWMPAHPGLFLKREVYERVGPFKTDYRIAGDFDFVARAFSQPLAYKHVPEIVVKMRAGGASTGGLKSTILLNKEVMRACRENGIRTNWFKLLSKYPAKLAELVRR